jgi:hypothetical protein
MASPCGSREKDERAFSIACVCSEELYLINQQYKMFIDPISYLCRSSTNDEAAIVSNRNIESLMVTA